jgi:hypothetical protein
LRSSQYFKGKEREEKVKEKLVWQRRGTIRYKLLSLTWRPAYTRSAAHPLSLHEKERKIVGDKKEREREKERERSYADQTGDDPART